MEDKKKRLYSLAVVESNFGRSPLSILEAAESGSISIFCKLMPDEITERSAPKYFQINIIPLMSLVRQVGFNTLFDRDGVRLKTSQHEKFLEIFPLGKNVGATPLKENLFVSSGDLQKLKNSEDTRSLNSNQSHPYSVPQSTPWSKITITFHGGPDGMDTDFVRLKAPDMEPLPFKYSQLDFNDSRNDEPDSFWKLLIDFAKNKGELKVDKDKRGAIKNLRKLLNKITGLIEDPILSVGKSTYRTVFTIQYHVKEDTEDRPKPSLAEQEIASIHLPQRNKRPGS